MADEAKVRVRLDLDGARADLAGLYREMSNAPGVPVSGVQARGPAAPPGPGRGGPGLGFGAMGFMRNAMALGGIVGAGAFLRDSAGTAANVGGALTGGVSEQLNDILFGNVGSRATGGRQALEQMKGQLSLAVGFGADPSNFQSIFDTIGNIETKRAEGARQLDLFFKPQIAADTAEGLLDRIAKGVEAIVQLAQRFG